MSETLLINAGPGETRVVLLENGVVRDIAIERTTRRGKIGNIYRGKVVRVLPGMQSAFVDFGDQRTGLLHVSDLVVPAGSPRRGKSGGEAAIEQLLHDGEKLSVQVTREPVGDKGARLSTDLSLSSRLLVFIPASDRLAVSHSIEDSVERARLLLLIKDALAQEGVAAQGGYILRTAAQGAQLAELCNEIRFLQRLWVAVNRRSQAAIGPQLLYEELPLYLRAVRDLARPSLDRIVVDQLAAYLALRTFCEDCVPELSPLLEHYTDATPLFELHGAEYELQQALGRRVQLDCGGYLVIDRTEAMTVVDVNTGSFTGQGSVDETVLQTNLEAAAALARQLRLRNVGGIVVVDFIDMTTREHRQQVQLALQEALQCDPVRTTFNSMSGLGLVAMTRQRTGESLEDTLCEDCPVCHGHGLLKSARTVCYEIFREVSRAAANSNSPELVVVAAPAVTDLLNDEESDRLAELQLATGTTICVRSEPGYTREHFDLAIIQNS